MPEWAVRRHDLVWLAADWPVAECLSDLTEQDLFSNWLQRQLPLIAGRQNPAVAGLQLGFTQPGTETRRRVGVCVPRAAVHRISPPPLLRELLPVVPADWLASLTALADDFSTANIQVRVYGSLLNQIFSGEACLRAGSDLDLLIECRDVQDINAALSILRHAADSTPRLDGELRRTDGRAVAWRELAQVLDAAASRETSILVKANSSISLLPVAAFLSE